MVDFTNSNLKITKILLDLTGRDMNFVELVPNISDHDYRYSLDTTKIIKVFDWMSVISLKNSFRMTLSVIKIESW